MIEYVIDGLNRRVGKKVDGRLVKGFIYQSQTQIAAETDGRGRILRSFVYGSKSNIPDYVVQDGKTYRIISDQVGTPKLVVDSSTGNVVESLRFDEFGVSSDEDGRSMLPFGFAGGLFDREVGLVRFGARDYDPSVGRWTSKDPLVFGGGDTNLYGYVFNDPINGFDPSGKFDVAHCAIDVGALVGLFDTLALYEGAKTCRTDPNNNENIHDVLQQIKFFEEQAAINCGPTPILPHPMPPIAGNPSGGLSVLSR